MYVFSLIGDGSGYLRSLHVVKCSVISKLAPAHSSWSRRCSSVSAQKESLLVYTTQVNSTFRARWLANSEVISQVLFTSEQPKKNKITFVGTFSRIKLLFGPLVIQLLWYILKQLFTSVSVKVVDIKLAASRLGKYLPLFTSTSVNDC